MSTNLILSILAIDAVLIWAIAYVLFSSHKILKSSDIYLFGSFVGKLIPLLLLGLSVTALYTSPKIASELVISDSIEYTVSALKLLREGIYSIDPAGVDLPPRFPPGFSVFLLVPTHLISGTEIGLGIIPITFLSIIGIAAAYLIGKRFSGSWGATAAVLLLLNSSIYRYFSSSIMTDIPSTAIFLLLALHFMILQEKDKVNTFDFLSAGLLTACAFSFRFTCGALLLPFLIPITKKKGAFNKFCCFFILVIPLLSIAWFYLLYNISTFGDLYRTGYHFWVGVPYDYPELVFSSEYLYRNLLESESIWQLLAFLLCTPFIQKGVKKLTKKDVVPFGFLKNGLLFIGLSGVPLLVFYLFYFYPSVRFYLPLQAVLLVLAGSILGGIAYTSDYQDRILTLGLMTLLVCVVFFRLHTDILVPGHRSAAENLKELTPENAVIISSLNPLYLQELVVRNSNRTILPISRKVEFASKVLTRYKIYYPDPPPKDAFDHRCSGLLRDGAQEVFQTVALENLDVVTDYLSTNRPVFVLTTNMSEEDRQALKDKFSLEDCKQSICQVVIKKQDSSSKQTR